MKKLFLAAAIFSYSSSYGQQDDLLDIQKYLEKKSSKEKNIIINPHSKILRPGCETTGQNILSLPKNRKIFSLPQDNMPCIVTDLTAFNMPNVYYPGGDLALLLAPGNRPGKMPNAAQLSPIIVVK